MNVIVRTLGSAARGVAAVTEAKYWVRSPHYMMALLYVICLISYVDRQLISLLLSDIKHDLRLQDWQLGFVSGTSFAVFYVLMGVPLSRLADRRPRTSMLAVCLTAWSLMTALCGAVTGFVQLALVRVGVAVGEAGGYPASLSLISDIYPVEKRATMTAVFFSATTAGALVAMVVGGAINEWVGWRWTLVIAAAPGFLLAVLLTLTVREPARGGMDAAPAIAVLVPPHFWSAIRMLFANPLYRVVAIASAIGAIEQFSIAVWAPTYAMRAFSLGTRDVGLGLGLALGLGSGLVMIATGGLGDRLTRRSPAAPVFLAAAGQLLCMPLLFLALSVHQFPAFCAIFAVGYGAMACGGAMTIAATQVVIPATLRATGATLLVMMATLAGFGLGPPLVGAISDHLPTLAPDARLRWALIGGLAFNAVSAVMLIVAARRRGRDHRNSVASKPGIATV